MAEFRCPGQDMRCWRPEDIFLGKCPSCGAEIEIWKDEPFRYCPSCRTQVRNPKLDCGCTQWCKHALDCLTPMLGDQDPSGPIPSRLSEPR